MMEIEQNDNPWLCAISDYQRMQDKIQQEKRRREEEERQKQREEEEKEEQRRLIEQEQKEKELSREKEIEELKELKRLLDLNKLDQSLIKSSAAESKVQPDVHLKYVYKQKRNVSEYLWACSWGLLVTVFCFIGYRFYSFFQTDVLNKVHERSSEIQMRLLQCSKQYTINNCDSVVSIAPHMATVCQEWQACMQSNPTHVNHLSILGELGSLLLNSFIEPLTWKSVVVVSVWFIACLYFTSHFLNQLVKLFTFQRQNVTPVHHQGIKPIHS